jgi:hypothetical protein
MERIQTMPGFGPGRFRVASKRDWWSIGNDYYHKGISQFEDLPQAIRSMGYYLFVGDPAHEIPAIRDGDERAELIIEVIDDSLDLSRKWKRRIHREVRSCCSWSRNETDTSVIAPKNQSGNERSHKKAFEKLKAAYEKYISKMGTPPGLRELARIARSGTSTVQKFLQEVKEADTQREFTVQRKQSFLTSNGTEEDIAPVCDTDDELVRLLKDLEELEPELVLQKEFGSPSSLAGERSAILPSEELFIDHCSSFSSPLFRTNNKKGVKREEECTNSATDGKISQSAPPCEVRTDPTVTELLQAFDAFQSLLARRKDLLELHQSSNPWLIKAKLAFGERWKDMDHVEKMEMSYRWYKQIRPLSSSPQEKVSLDNNSLELIRTEENEFSATRKRASTSLQSAQSLSSMTARAPVSTEKAVPPIQQNTSTSTQSEFLSPHHQQAQSPTNREGASLYGEDRPRPVPAHKHKCDSCGRSGDFVYNGRTGRNVFIEPGVATDRNEKFNPLRHTIHRCHRQRE